MKNVDKKLLYILCVVMCVCFVFGFTTTTANAEEVITCNGKIEVGNRIYLSCINTYDVATGKTEVVFNIDEIATEETMRCCYFLQDWDGTPSGKAIFCGGTFPKISSEMRNGSTSMGVGYGTNIDQIGGFSPYPYATSSQACLSSAFITNIPIFENVNDADLYVGGDDSVLSKAINYNKTYDSEGDVWVTPFDNIQINDSDMPLPSLSKVSHNGFTVKPPDERYMVDIYLESGIQSPALYVKSLTRVENSYYINNFGLISDIEGAFTGTIELDKDYGIDNRGALLESCNSFYSEFPNLKSYADTFIFPDKSLGINTKTFAIWGQPFGKNFVFWTKSADVGTTVSSIDIIPIAYTNYKVRYYYFDDTSGFHYGPWVNFIYFSDGRVYNNYVYQGKDGSIIETPLQSGNQDASGNVNISGNTNLIDLENPNGFFGYIRSLLNNVDATMNTYSTLFAMYFSFIPSDLQAVIWLGIAIMVLTGVILAIIKS